jgi:hypothetical protein
MSSHQIFINVILQQTLMTAWLHHQKVLVWLMTQSPIRSISLTHASKHQIFQVSDRDNRHLLRVVAGQINDPSPGYVNGIGTLAQFNPPSGLAISSLTPPPSSSLSSLLPLLPHCCCCCDWGWYGLNSTHELVIVGIIAFVKLSSQHLRLTQSIICWDLWSRCCRQHGFVDGMEWNW